MSSCLMVEFNALSNSNYFKSRFLVRKMITLFYHDIFMCCGVCACTLIYCVSDTLSVCYEFVVMCVNVSYKHNYYWNLQVWSGILVRTSTEEVASAVAPLFHSMAWLWLLVAPSSTPIEVNLLVPPSPHAVVMK